MGSYGEEDDPAPASPAAEAGFDDIPVADSAPALPEPQVREPLSATAENEPDDDADDLSGMLADLEPLEDVPPPPISVVPDPEPLEADAPNEPEAVAEIVEDELVAVEADDSVDSTDDTGALRVPRLRLCCDLPNQEDLTPVNCGSFQWKAV